MYEYKATITRVIDGDTYDFLIDLGFGITYKDRLRLDGIDTPEVRGLERPEGLAVKEQVIKLIEGKEVHLRTRKWQGKYGRYIADVMFKVFPEDTFKLDLAQYLLRHDMARKVDY